MEPEKKDLVSMLLRDGGGIKFFVDTLLRLNPRDLKACRLVCWEWHLFIRDEVWGSKAGRAKLERKLVDRWMNDDGDDLTATKIGEARGKVESLFCDNQRVFCGYEYVLNFSCIRNLLQFHRMIISPFAGKIGVYTLSGEHVRILGEDKLHPDSMAG